MRTAPSMIAWCLALAALAMIAGGLVLNWIAAEQHVPDSGSAWLYPFLVAAVSAPAAVGALIVSRRARNPIGWILVVGALSLAAVLAATPYARVALEAHPGSLPGGSWAALVSSLWPVFFAWPLAIAFVFPDGRLPSPRWRPYALFGACAMTLLFVVLVVADELESPFADVPNPLSLRLPDALGFLRPLAWLSVFASLIVGAAAIRVRYRRSKGIERLQMLWLAYAALLIPLGVVWFLVLSLAVGEAGSGNAALAFLLAMEAAVAIAVGVAVTRYRLYDIDRLINRTLVYGVVTASLGLLYSLVSLLAGVAAGRGSTWVTAVAVLVVAAAFRPLRSRAQAAVDWRFDRVRYEGLRRMRVFVDDVREGRRDPENVGPVLAEALRDPGAELLFRLPESDAYAARLGTVVARPSGGDLRRDPGGASRAGDRAPPPHARPARSPRFAPQRPCGLEPRDRDRAPPGRSAPPARGGGGIASARRACGLRGTAAARARSPRRRSAAARDARDRAAAVAALAAARGANPRPGARLGGGRDR